MSSLEERIKQQAHHLGFELAGIARAGEADGFDRLREWLDHEYDGEMRYMRDRAELLRHPASVLPSVRSVVMVGMNYYVTLARRASEGSEQPSLARRANIARYAQGQRDYHDILRERLNALLAWVQEQVPGTRGRGVVDTAPLLERDFSRRAGLGWIGKNTMLLNKRIGSWFFLGALLLDLDLNPDTPHIGSHCGTCTACLDACPTDAFPQPGVLDARRCISYLTIELRGSIPEELREGVGDWLFGCDVCQEVCPWNRKAPTTSEPAFQPRDDLVVADPIEMLGLSEEEFRCRFRDTPLFRTRRRGLLRNAAIVLGNRGDRTTLPVLQKALDDEDPIIRDAVRWALDRIETSQPTSVEQRAADTICP